MAKFKPQDLFTSHFLLYKNNAKKAKEIGDIEQFKYWKSAEIAMNKKRLAYLKNV